MFSGKEFQSLEVLGIKESRYKFVLDLGICINYFVILDSADWPGEHLVGLKFASIEVQFGVPFYETWLTLTMLVSASF